MRVWLFGTRIKSRAVSLEAGIGQTLIRADRHYQWKTEIRPWISKQNSNLEQKIDLWEANCFGYMN